MANRIKRLMVNGARNLAAKTQKTKIKDAKKELAYELSPERDNAIDLRSERDLMASRFQEWIDDFIGRPKTPDQVVDELNKLVGIVEETLVSSESLRKATVDIILAKLAQTNELNNIVKSATVKAQGRCSICKEPNISGPIPLRVAMYKAYHLLCNKCGTEIPATDCKIIKTPAPK